MPLRHRFRLPVATAALCALFLAACGNPINVRSDFDRSADYGSYRTYAFYSPLATDKAGAEAALKSAGSALDRAAAKGLIHKNKAARHKSRLSAKIRAMA